MYKLSNIGMYVVLDNIFLFFTINAKNTAYYSTYLNYTGILLVYIRLPTQDSTI